MDTPDTNYRILPTFLQKAIELEFDKVAEEEIEKAKQRIEARKKEVIAGVILDMQKSLSIENHKEHVIISIRLIEKN